MTHVTCRLTAKNRDQLRNPTLGNRVCATFYYFKKLYKLWHFMTRGQSILVWETTTDKQSETVYNTTTRVTVCSSNFLRRRFATPKA